MGGTRRNSCWERPARSASRRQNGPNWNPEKAELTSSSSACWSSQMTNSELGRTISPRPFVCCPSVLSSHTTRAAKFHVADHMVHVFQRTSPRLFTEHMAVKKQTGLSQK